MAEGGAPSGAGGVDFCASARNLLHVFPCRVCGGSEEEAKPNRDHCTALRFVVDGAVWAVWAVWAVVRDGDERGGRREAGANRIWMPP
jgi:hypothetical protein